MIGLAVAVTSVGALGHLGGVSTRSSAADAEHSSVCQEGIEVLPEMICHPDSYSQGLLDGDTGLGRADGTSWDLEHHLALVTDTFPKRNTHINIL